METRTSYLMVGTFVLVLIAGLFGFAAWLAKASFDEGEDVYHIYFTGSVTGLQPGSPVSYRGLPVGVVTDIRIDPENVERVRVTVDVAEGTPIKTDAIASLEMQGITGTSFVQITGGTAQAPALDEVADGVPVIPSRPSSLAEVVEAAPRVLENLILLSERLSLFLSDENSAAVAATLSNVETVTGALAATTEGLPETIAEARQTLVGINALTVTLQQAAGTLAARADDTLATVDRTAARADEELERTAAEIRELTTALRATADQATAMIEENREPVLDFTAGSLYDFNLLITEVRDLAANIGRLATRIERDPANFLLGGSRRGVTIE